MKPTWLRQVKEHICFATKLSLVVLGISITLTGVARAGSHRLSTACNLNMGVLNFGNIYQPTTLDHQTSFQIVCGSANLADGVVSYKVSIPVHGLGTFSRRKLMKGATFALYSDASHHHLVGNGRWRSKTIEGDLIIHDYHGETPWVPIYAVLHVKKLHEYTVATKNLTVNYTLQYK